VVETCKTNIEDDFPDKDTCSGHGEGEIKDHYCREKKCEESKHDCAEEKLIEVIIAGIDTVT